jgi:hypothetical protein
MSAPPPLDGRNSRLDSVRNVDGLHVTLLELAQPELRHRHRRDVRLTAPRQHRRRHRHVIDRRPRQDVVHLRQVRVLQHPTVIQRHQHRSAAHTLTEVVIVRRDDVLRVVVMPSRIHPDRRTVRHLMGDRDDLHPIVRRNRDVPPVTRQILDDRASLDPVAGRTVWSVRPPLNSRTHRAALLTRRRRSPGGTHLRCVPRPVQPNGITRRYR